MSSKVLDPKIWDAIKEQRDELPDGLPLRPVDPPRSQALEEPAPVVNQTLTAESLIERLGEVFYEASRQPYSRKGIRAVLAELAAMGGEAWDEIAAEAKRRAQGYACEGTLDTAGKIAAPILAAKDATIAEQSRALEEVNRTAAEAQTAWANVLEERDAALAEVARLKAETDALRGVIAENERTESESVDLGCGDSSCVVAPPKGQATNGRCRCGPHKLRMVVKALCKRVRILEIAPFAAHYAHNTTGRGYCPEDAAAAAHAITHNDAPTDWAKAALEYAAKEGLT